MNTLVKCTVIVTNTLTATRISHFISYFTFIIVHIWIFTLNYYLLLHYNVQSLQNIVFADILFDDIIEAIRIVQYFSVHEIYFISSVSRNLVERGSPKTDKKTTVNVLIRANSNKFRVIWQYFHAITKICYYEN